MKQLFVTGVAFGIVILYSVAPAQFTPRWRVGEWWIVKLWCPDVRSVRNAGWRWQHRRYDVIGIEKVDGKDCYVLQEKIGDTTGARDGPRDLYYVRKDSWKIVREVEYFWQMGKLKGPKILNCPQGMFGPVALGEPRLPLFPLDAVPLGDSTFRDCQLARTWSWFRQFSGIADSTLLNLYRDEPDTLGGRPVPLRGGKLFFVLSELGVEPHRGGPIVPNGYSLQLWSGDYPWRLYEEWGWYAPASGARQSWHRTWLVRCGHSGI